MSLYHGSMIYGFEFYQEATSKADGHESPAVSLMLGKVLMRTLFGLPKSRVGARAVAMYGQLRGTGFSAILWSDGRNAFCLGRQSDIHAHMSNGQHILGHLRKQRGRHGALTKIPLGRRQNRMSKKNAMNDCGSHVHRVPPPLC